MRIALFLTCFNDTLFPDTGRAVVRLLERLAIAETGTIVLDGGSLSASS